MYTVAADVLSGPSCKSGRTVQSLFLNRVFYLFSLNELRLGSRSEQGIIR